MNELKYFELPKRKADVTQDGVQLLEKCIKYAFALSESGKTMDAVNLVSGVFGLLNAPFLESCVNQLLLRSVEMSEQRVYKLFRENYRHILGKECEIVSRKNSLKHIPDFWVKIGSEHIPVECKVSEFNKKALKQLLRYMKVYKCKRGIAVASQITCDLPNSITPILIEQLKEKAILHNDIFV